MSTRLSRSLGLVGLVLLSAACDRTEPAPTASPEPKPAATTAATTQGGAANPGAANGDAPIFHPERATEKAPETFKVQFGTTKGDFTVQVTRAWAPNGADRFYNLIKLGYYDGNRFFRAVDGFMVQWGIHGTPAVNGAWFRANIPDDPVVKSNKRGFITFAMAGKNSRTTQLFINYTDANARLDAMGFPPFGEVVEGMTVVDSLYKGYGEGAPRGKGPDQGRLQREGNSYLDREFKELDAIKSAKLL
jgi:peptidyl-prolyl cis-trans isomerase A (cyclophilin A)